MAPKDFDDFYFVLRFSDDTYAVLSIETDDNEIRLVGPDPAPRMLEEARVISKAERQKIERIQMRLQDKQARERRRDLYLSLKREFEPEDK